MYIYIYVYIYIYIYIIERWNNHLTQHIHPFTHSRISLHAYQYSDTNQPQFPFQIMPGLHVYIEFIALSMYT